MPMRVNPTATKAPTGIRVGQGSDGRSRALARRAIGRLRSGLPMKQQQETPMHSTSPEFKWTDDTIRELRRLWSERNSTAEIGRTMGISKNAVVGKAHRLDLPGRPSPIRTGSAPRSPRVPRPRSIPRLADIKPLPCLSETNISPPLPHIARTVAPARPAAIAPRRIGAHSCCWPIGEPGTPAFRFCDEPAPLDVPYCDEHARLAYRPRRRRDTTDETLVAQLR